MKGLFHHSLIKIIVLYHLKDINIAWSTFIANPIFTQASTQDIPSLSHPPSSIPSSQPMHYSSSSDELVIPSPPLSPLHEPVLSSDRKGDSGKGKSDQGQSSKLGRVNLGTLVHTYQSRNSKVFDELQYCIKNATTPGATNFTSLTRGLYKL